MDSIVNPVASVAIADSPTTPTPSPSQVTNNLYAAYLEEQLVNPPLTALPPGAYDESYLLNLSPDTFTSLAAEADNAPPVSEALAQEAAAEYTQTALNADLFGANAAATLPVDQLPLTDTLDALLPLDALQGYIAGVSQNAAATPAQANDNTAAQNQAAQEEAQALAALSEGAVIDLVA